MKLTLLNDSILIRIRKSATEMKTASGIILPLVEQDTNFAEVVAVPTTKTYTTIAREADGTYIRDEDEKPKEIVRHVIVEPGDRVLLEKRKVADYDFHYRHITERTYFLADYTREQNDDYDYFITRHDDILGVVTGELNIDPSNPIGELFSQIPPKPVTRSAA